MRAELENIWLYPEQPYIDFRNEVGRLRRDDAGEHRPRPRQPRAHRRSSRACCCGRATRRGAGADVRPVRADLGDPRGDACTACRCAGSSLDLEALAETARASGCAHRLDLRPEQPDRRGARAGRMGRFLDALCPDGCVAVVDEAYADFVQPERRIRRELDVVERAPRDRPAQLLEALRARRAAARLRARRRAARARTSTCSRSRST